MDAFWIILSSSLIAVTCSLLGCYLVLRKMAMIGDAISHAVLPGIVIAYLISGSREALPMLIGAAIIGVFTTVLIELFYKKAKLQIDASIGITFTWLFAIGIILISLFAGQVDLDQDCVLYGEIAYVPLDLWITDAGVNMGPRTVWISASLLILILSFIIIGYKGLFLTTFNEEFAKALGIAVGFWHYSLMSAVSLTTVISFESVGAILVVAFLIVPASAAYLITHKLKEMLILSAIFSVLSSIGGYYLAAYINGSIAGAIASVAGILFLFCWLISMYRKRNNTSRLILNSTS
ncbi:MAG: metal ABC transporter permease [Bacteroidetes bacterium]|nr:MAG: metal ABC transporter permease [Bacteroidota bacterium]MBL1145278.1 metal ABC transporter permease [Bacteroidota bacterium]MCB0803852.1 metal ABC transporter permease [Flavobacteriales bacterium]NOG58074.1 metal ABC transporter permease [Bacteroidota bacterium]